MDVYSILEELCEMVTNKLAEATKKIHSSGNLSSSDFDYLDKMTHTLKSIKTTMAMIDAEDRGAFADGGSERYDSYRSYADRSYRDRAYRDRSYDDGSYDDGSYDEGSSERRGRMRAKRDSMGRYASSMSNHDRLLSELKEMMPDAPDDQTKQEIRQLINRLEKR